MLVISILDIGLNSEVDYCIVCIVKKCFSAVLWQKLISDYIRIKVPWLVVSWSWPQWLCARIWCHQIQSTPVTSRQLGAKIREHELSGSLVISLFRAKAQTRDFQDQSPTLWRLHVLNPNSMLSDNGVLTFRVSLQTSTSHQQQITTSHIIF